MITTFKAENPKDIEITMTFTMPLRDWKDLAEQIEKEYPGWKFAAEIRQMVQEMQKTFIRNSEGWE
jgi:hypothetical protein